VPFLKRCFFLVVLLAVASCSTLGVFGPKEASYNNAQLQKHLSKRFPRDWSGLGLMNVRLSSPVVEMPKGSSRINLSVDVAAALGNHRPQPMGRIQLESDLRFDKTQQAIFLDRPRLLSSNLSGVGTLGKDANNIASLLLNELADRMPIYRVEDAYTDGFGREWKLDDAQVSNGKLRVRMIRADQ
jgi:Protein of unknown function (DUF1439)